MRIPGLLALAALLTSGCSTVHPIGPVDASAVTYKSPSFSPTDLKDARLAVLPIAASDGNEGFRRSAGERLCAALEKNEVAAEVIRPEEVADLLGEGNLAADVDRLLFGFERTGIVDKDALARIGEATGCRFLLTTGADSKQTRDDYQAGYTHKASTVASASLRCRLWDAASGDVVWEGEGAAGVLTNAPHNGTHAQALGLAANGVACRVGKGPNEAGAPHDIDRLHDADQRQNVRVATEGENALHLMLGAIYVGAAVAEIVAD